MNATTQNGSTPVTRSASTRMARMSASVGMAMGGAWTDTAAMVSGSGRGGEGSGGEGRGREGKGEGQRIASVLHIIRLANINSAFYYMNAW